MKARITVITIGVDDLQRALRFYRDGLSLKTAGIIGEEIEHGAVAFFDLEGDCGAGHEKMRIRAHMYSYRDL